MLEIYNEQVCFYSLWQQCVCEMSCCSTSALLCDFQVRDLLNPKSNRKGGLKVREHPKKGFYGMYVWFWRHSCSRGVIETYSYKQFDLWMDSPCVDWWWNNGQMAKETGRQTDGQKDRQIDGWMNRLVTGKQTDRLTDWDCMTEMDWWGEADGDKQSSRLINWCLKGLMYVRKDGEMEGNKLQLDWQIDYWVDNWVDWWTYRPTRNKLNCNRIKGKEWWRNQMSV